jgi:hypothetical protein
VAEDRLSSLVGAPSQVVRAPLAQASPGREEVAAGSLPVARRHPHLPDHPHSDASRGVVDRVSHEGQRRRPPCVQRVERVALLASVDLDVPWWATRVGPRAWVAHAGSVVRVGDQPMEAGPMGVGGAGSGSDDRSVGRPHHPSC